jgi:hypothetical protein
MKKLKLYLIVIGACFLLSNCKKEDTFLNAKPNQALFIPSTLKDLESILNNQNIFNTSDPGLGEIAADDYYLTSDILNNEDITDRNGYIWAKQLYNAGQSINDWNGPYQQVYYANTILDYLPKIAINTSQQAEADQIKASALFFRSIAFYNLVQTFAMPYDAKNSSTDLGIPLRLSSDLNSKSVRPTVQQCYDQILSDLQTALPLLPVKASYQTLPSRPAANALLARVYLAMANYPKAFQYADASLVQFNTLTDYNTLTPTPYAINTKLLSEDIFHTSQQGWDNVFPNNVGIADSILYNSYTVNDLRRTVCFVINNGLPYFSGTYDLKYYNYSGIATDEIYLIRAECNARAGNTSAALKDLNTLLVTRWKTGTFIPYSANSADQALTKILTERRKELLFRGLRWTDLRRLNKESRFAITLTRVYNGATYTLPPNDPKYAMPIPDNEISVSGIQQNPR